MKLWAFLTATEFSTSRPYKVILICACIPRKPGLSADADSEEPVHAGKSMYTFRPEAVTHVLICSGAKQQQLGSTHCKPRSTLIRGTSHCTTHLQLGLQILSLLLQSLNCMCPLASSAVQVHGDLAGQWVYGTSPAQHSNLAGALPTQPSWAQGDPSGLLLLNIAPLKGCLPAAALQPCMTDVAL